ncbi:MAG: CHC2 zinc finger domain-containing protein, partial [Pseudomonadota bacterium]
MGKLIKFDHVNENGDFEKVLSHFNIDYTKSGTQLRCLCPFHEDTNPSLSITLVATEKALPNTYSCFGCGNKGSIIDFAAHMANCDLRDGAELVAEVSGCSLAPARTGGRKKKTARPPSKKSAKSAGERRTADRAENGRDTAETDPEAAPGQSEAVSDDKPINPPLRFSLTLDAEHPYVTDRITQQTATTFGVGVCDPNGRSMMVGRCCVPIHNLAGELVAYAGRYLGEDPAEPKWKLPPGFEKRRVLFNAHRIWGALHVVLVEGFFDAMHLHSLGIPAVSCIGTAVSEEQVQLLQELGARRVTVLFDGDEEGQIAAKAA